MEVDRQYSIEECLAQAMIDLRKGHSSINYPIHQRRDHLLRSIMAKKEEMNTLWQENKILKDLEERIKSIRTQINPIREIGDHLSTIKHGKCHNSRDKYVQTDPIENIIISNLTNRERMLQERLRSLQLAENRNRPDYVLLKRSEYDAILCGMSPKDSTSYQDMGIENNTDAPSTNLQPYYLTSGSTSTSLSKITTTTNSSSNKRTQEESDEDEDEGVQLLLSMKKNVFKCKCGEYLNSITDWSEHQRICSKSTEKTIGEQCQLCKKTFLTCVALNIHSTKKHNKKKVRTDSIMHCPCGQSFTAKWRQNCVHKLNSHGRHCKAFKEIETQCSICKKGFIDRKSLEYHGLKAHKLAVPVNS